MQECRYCKQTIQDGDLFCKYCGYDPSTDMMRKDFVPQAKAPNKKTTSISRGGVGSGVKKFVFIGLAVFIFSIFYKNHFNISNVIAEIKNSVIMLLKGKSTAWKPKPSQKEVQWIDMRTFVEPEK